MKLKKTGTVTANFSLSLPDPLLYQTFSESRCQIQMEKAGEEIPESFSFLSAAQIIHSHHNTVFQPAESVNFTIVPRFLETVNTVN